MAGFDRYEHILRLLASEQSEWNIAELAQALERPQSTIYRIVRELLKAGFVEGARDSRYRLGPAFLEFEHCIRKQDPLIRSGELFLPALVQQAGVPVVGLLARLYNQQVMCVADARTETFKPNPSYERGRPMPIFKGATSKVILAGLSGRARNKLLKALQIEQGAQREALDRELEQIRRKNFIVGQGEIDPGLIGIVVPVRHVPLGIHASLSLIANLSDYNDELQKRLVPLLTGFAKGIEHFLETGEAVLPTVEDPPKTRSQRARTA